MRTLGFHDFMMTDQSQFQSFYWRNTKYREQVLNMHVVGWAKVTSHDLFWLEVGKSSSSSLSSSSSSSSSSPPFLHAYRHIFLILVLFCSLLSLVFLSFSFFNQMLIPRSVPHKMVTWTERSYRFNIFRHKQSVSTSILQNIFKDNQHFDKNLHLRN